MTRLVRDLSSVLILAGLLLVTDAVVTLLWQEPVTPLVATVKRGEINERFLSPNIAMLPAVDRHALAGVATLGRRMKFLARLEQRSARSGEAIGRMSIAKLGASFDVIQGTDSSSLERGPGHYPVTAFPGLGRTVAIAGHRTTYLAPFRHIDALARGNTIVLTMPYGRFTYVVQGHRIVPPTALWVIRNVGYERLVLSACHPVYSAAQRIVVFARLRHVQPRGAAQTRGAAQAA